MLEVFQGLILLLGTVAGALLLWFAWRLARSDPSLKDNASEERLMIVRERGGTKRWGISRVLPGWVVREFLGG